VIAVNFTPVVRSGYRIGLPVAGRWREALNTDGAVYGGTNVGNGGHVVTEPHPFHGCPHSAEVTLPPLAAIVLSTV
jgi:1,4-alpha-glucan branching enzyme